MRNLSGIGDRGRRLLLGSVLPCILTAIPGLAGAEPCKRVNIDSVVTINGKVWENVPVKAGTDWDILEEAMGIDSDGAVTMKTDSAGRIQGHFDYCNDDPPPLMFKFRTDFNEGTLHPTESNANYNFKNALDFSGDGAQSFREPPPEARIKLRFPVKNPNVINHAKFFVGSLAYDPIGGLAAYLLGGPMGLDHRPPPRSGKDHCLDYDDRGSTWGIGLPFCYGGHDGTDYMLIGGFDQMDNAKNYVVAAADGYVVKVVDHLYDRCRFVTDPSDNDPFNVTCDGHNGDASGKKTFLKNYITIDHGFDHWDKDKKSTNVIYNVKTRYLHIKQFSAQVKVGDFVSCGQTIAEIGSSGNSSAPHLHFDVNHNGNHVDPYRGKLSSQRYWVVQDSGVRGLPGTQCQDPKQRYGHTIYQASLEVEPPVDLGFFNAPPSGLWSRGKARWWRIKATVPQSGLTGFTPALTRVKWTLPTNAVAHTPPTDKVGVTVTFYMPIANARDPSLANYSFDVIADVTQEQLVAGVQATHKFKHVELPRPELALSVHRREVIDKLPEQCGVKAPVYQIVYQVKPKGLLGGTPTFGTTAISTSTLQPIAAHPISVCTDGGAKVTFTATDSEGVESVTTTRTLHAPRFVPEVKVLPNRRAGATIVTIPPAHQGEQPFTTSVYKEVRITTDPQDHGGEPLQHAIPKPNVSIAWTAPQYLDRETATWKPFTISKISADPNAAITARQETRKFPNDTLILTFKDATWPTRFSVKLTGHDGWKRTLTEVVSGANGELPPPSIPRGLRDLLFVAGFQIDQGDPAPREIPGLSFGDAELATVSKLVQRLMLAQGRTDRVAMPKLRADIRSFKASARDAKVARLRLSPKPIVH